MKNKLKSVHRRCSYWLAHKWPTVDVNKPIKRECKKCGMKYEDWIEDNEANL